LLQPTAYGPGGSGSTTASESARAPAPRHSESSRTDAAAPPRSEMNEVVDLKR